MKKVSRNFSIGKKLGFLLTISIILVVLIAVLFSSLEFIRLMKDQANVQAIKGVEGLSQQIDSKKENAKDIAVLLSTNKQIINAVNRQDTPELGKEVAKITKNINMDFMVFTDANGVVLFRSNDVAKYGDNITKQDSVKNALSGKEVVFVEKGLDAPLLISAGYPIRNDSGKIIGAVSTGYRLDKNDLLDECKVVLQTDLTIFCDNIRISTTIENNGARVIGTELAPAIANVVLNQKKDYSGEAEIIGQNYITYYLPILDSGNNAIGVLFAGRSMAQFNSDLQGIIVTIVIISAIAILAVVVLSLLFVRGFISKPLQKTMKLANELSEGDLENEILIKNKDEIGDLAKILDVNVRDAFRKIEKARIDINNASNQVASGTQQLSDGSQLLSSGATQQASSLQELTASVAEIAEQSDHNAKSANKANKLSMEARDYATEGNVLMNNMQKAMADINKSSMDISKIIKVIDDIAFQTNILALNAAVEAARAGVHGKGFAVVAEEVRNLAAKSATAAKETTVLIEDSITNVNSGTDIADKTAESLRIIVTTIGEAVTLVGEIASSSSEQASAVMQINSALDQLSKVVQVNSATAEETAASSEELSGQAELLKDMVRMLKIGND